MKKINVLFTIAYKGTNYSGWQVQPHKKTIQGEIESVLSKLFNEKVEVVGSGRTDAGVHALAAKANAILNRDFLTKHFSKNGKVDFLKFKDAINRLLPKDIQILAVKKVALNFNARFSAKQKTYEYRLQNGGTLSPFDGETTVLVHQKLDLEKMAEASKFLIGEHDFTTFCSAQTQTIDHIRTIYDIKIFQKSNKIFIDITGNGFLYNMVRIIVGTLVDVGLGKIASGEIKRILNSKDRSKAGKTYPSNALFLKKVVY